MVCSTCGYDNPREHRYCGMCGTPFPHRPFTAPAAQSTLAFSATPPELASPPSVYATEALAPSAIETQTASHRQPVEQGQGVTETVEAAAVAPPVVDTPETQLRPFAADPEFVLPSPEPRILVEAPAVETASHRAGRLEPSIEPTEPLAARIQEESPLVAKEPVHEPPSGPEAPPAETPEPVPPVKEPEPPPAPVKEPPTPEPTPHDERRPREIRRPAKPLQQPTVAARPVAPPPQPAPARVEVSPRQMAALHPPPDSLPITPPPESAGMPTFQSVVEAAGAPPISPFEPPAKKDIDEDEELKEFVANFFYKPPEETADELTMRSEVPIVDQEEPAQFHHPSFDDDVAPPPEAHAHPDGSDFVPAAAETSRSRYLDITEPAPNAGADQPAPAAGSASFLHLNDPATIPADALPAKSHWLMWSSVVALLLIFGGLGFLEGRAQMTHEFRGPLEIAREQYGKLRQRISQMTASAPTSAPAPAANTGETDKQAPAQPEPAASNQTPAASNPQPDNAAQSAQPVPSTTTPATTEQQAQSQNPPPQPTAQQQRAAPDSGSPPDSTEVAKAEPSAPAKPLDAPPPKPSSKPQPGQAELAKALDASDPAAEAAWLWKATSRGNPEAPVRLADMYIKGKGVPHSCEQALVLLRSAAVKPNAPARNRLAALYANGTCVPRDRVRAYEFLAEALQADPASDWAQQSQKDLWNQMTPAERAEAQKFR